MSTYCSPLTSWAIRSIGNSGDRSSGPTGWPVPGCSTGGGGVGRSCSRLYHRVGSSSSDSRIFVGLMRATYARWHSTSHQCPDLSIRPGRIRVGAETIPTRGVAEMTEILLTGLKIGESARWHDGRLWLSNWGTDEVLAVDADGKTEVMATVPARIPFSIDWLPDGRLLIVSG